jgi:hypothetical protein
MFRNIIIGGAAAIALSAAAFTPALANYAACTENPEGVGCPGAIAAPSSQESLRVKVSEPRHAEIRQHATKQAYLNESVKKQSSTKGHESGARHARSHEAPSSRPAASNAKS